MEGANRGGRRHNGVVFGSKAVADEQRARAQRGAAASGARLRTAVAQWRKMPMPTARNTVGRGPRVTCVAQYGLRHRLTSEAQKHEDCDTT